MMKPNDEGEDEAMEEDLKKGGKANEDGKED
jgi:hypothetical protein